MRGFQVGQKLGEGQNALGAFASSLIDKINQNAALRQKFGLDIAEKQAMGPMETAEAVSKAKQLGEIEPAIAGEKSYQETKGSMRAMTDNPDYMNQVAGNATDNSSQASGNISGTSTQVSSPGSPDYIDEDFGGTPEIKQMYKKSYSLKSGPSRTQENEPNSVEARKLHDQVLGAAEKDRYEKIQSVRPELSTLNRYLENLNKALPGGDQGVPLGQRVEGAVQSALTGKGVINNPLLMALKMNSGPLSVIAAKVGNGGRPNQVEIPLFKAFFDQGGLSNPERYETMRLKIQNGFDQFDKETLRRLLKTEPGIQHLVELFHVDLESRGIKHFTKDKTGKSGWYFPTSKDRVYEE